MTGEKTPDETGSSEAREALMEYATQRLRDSLRRADDITSKAGDSLRGLIDDPEGFEILKEQARSTLNEAGVGTEEPSVVSSELLGLRKTAQTDVERELFDTPRSQF